VRKIRNKALNRILEIKNLKKEEEFL